MSTLNLSTLIQKLNQQCRDSLESAASLCLGQTHYTVEIEHWLLSLMEQPRLALPVICQHYQIDSALLIQDLRRAMEALKRGNNRSPALAVPLIEWIQQAWSMTSLQFNESQINSAHLLYALLSTPVLQQLAQQGSTQFSKIPLESLRAEFVNLVAHSSEGDAAGTPPSPSSHTSNSALDQFTTDLTASAREGKLDAVLGREQETRQLIDILIRRRQNNPILVGEAGVGKTAIVEGLALRIAAGNVPESLKEVSLRVLDLALLQAGAGVKGEFENRLKKVIAEIKASVKPIILFVDEAHTLIGSGAQAGQGDTANLLKPALARGELRTIAATTWAEYKKYLEKDAALVRRFQRVKVDEPDEATAIAMLRGLVPTLEQHHQVRILNEAVVAAVQLAKRYLPERQLPDKSVSLLDTACARVRLNQTVIPASLEDCQVQLEQLEAAHTLLARETTRGGQHKATIKELKLKQDQLREQAVILRQQWQNEQNLLQQICQLRQQLEENTLPATRKSHLQQLKQLERQLDQQQGERPLVEECVNANVIAKVLASWTGVPVGKMLKTEISTLQQLDQQLSERIMGQPQAMTTLTNHLQAARAHLTDPQKPTGVFLLLGSSGVGKTETALALADLLYGGEQALTVINMSEFKEEHKVSLLTGSPPGYVGYGEGGVLTEAVRRRPYSVVLLDEIEKAHPGVQDVFYQLFDKGVLMDSEGRLVDFSNALILMTSNACAETLLKLPNKTKLAESGKLVDHLYPELATLFKPAFLGRTTLVPYLPLCSEILESIVKMKLGKVQQRIAKRYGAILHYPSELLAHIVKHCRVHESGARNIDTMINQQLLPLLAEHLLAALATGKVIKQINVGLKSQELTLQIKH